MSFFNFILCIEMWGIVKDKQSYNSEVSYYNLTITGYKKLQSDDMISIALPDMSPIASYVLTFANKWNSYTNSYFSQFSRTLNKLFIWMLPPM